MPRHRRYRRLPASGEMPSDWSAVSLSTTTAHSAVRSRRLTLADAGAAYRAPDGVSSDGTCHLPATPSLKFPALAGAKTPAAQTPEAPHIFGDEAHEVLRSACRKRRSSPRRVCVPLEPDSRVVFPAGPVAAESRPGNECLLRYRESCEESATYNELLYVPASRRSVFAPGP